MDSFEIIGAGEPCGMFDHWVEVLNRVGIRAKQISIVEYDRQQGHNPVPHPRGNEVYVLVPADRLEEALNLLEKIIITAPQQKICVNDLAVLHYAVLRDSVGYNTGHGLMFVDGKEIGKVPCLAICKDKDSETFTLYYCDRDWKPIGVASYASVADAKERAERIYPGSSECWIDARR